MKKLFVALALALLLTLVLPAGLPARAQSLPEISLNSQYVIHSYGYAVINETVTFHNNGSSSVSIPDVQFGFTKNITSLIARGSYLVNGTGYTLNTGSNGTQTVFLVSSGGQTLAPNGTSVFSFKALLNDVAAASATENLTALVMTSPSVSVPVSSAYLAIDTPNVQFDSNPTGYQDASSLNGTYYETLTNPGRLAASSEVLGVAASYVADITPIVVYNAVRTISVGSNGLPMVQDYILLGNVGTSELTSLSILPLEPADNTVTVVPPAQPPLIVATQVSLVGDSIPLTDTNIALPVVPGANFTVVYTYPLSSQYYTSKSGSVQIDVPSSPPIAAMVDSYTLKLDLTPGVKAVKAPPPTLTDLNPLTAGTIELSYTLSVGWALDSGVPAASAIFVLVLVGLFAARTKTVGEGEEEEEVQEELSEDASGMIKAFEEKTALINSSLDEIPNTNPEELGKAYFDGLRGRIDTFRARALQRLNEVKQKSGSAKFTDLLTQMHDTEKEVDRAAKDLLNLYEQYYTKRMRREVFEKLLPNYRKRLDKAQNRLSDELNTAQKEAKLL